MKNKQAKYYNRHTKSLELLNAVDVVRVVPTEPKVKVWKKGTIIR